MMERNDMTISPDAKDTHPSRARRWDADRIGLVAMITGVAALCIAVLARGGFSELDARWDAIFLGLACFCLGLGAAYFVFARFRAHQTEQLRDDYASLHSRADALLARIRDVRLSSKDGE
jgi:hypothetical protein